MRESHLFLHVVVHLGAVALHLCLERVERPLRLRRALLLQLADLANLRLFVPAKSKQDQPGLIYFFDPKGPRKKLCDMFESLYKADPH